MNSNKRLHLRTLFECGLIKRNRWMMGLAFILVIETAYSDKDFRIEFNKVIGLNIERQCIIILTKEATLFIYVQVN